MRTLGIHSKHFKFAAKEKAGNNAEKLQHHKEEINIEKECIVIFAAVEKEDSKSPDLIAAQAVSDTEKRAEQLGIKSIVIYPYVHLTDSPGTPKTALKILDLMKEQLSKSYEDIRAPFGWYKSFDISCLGHQLSEWSGRYSPDKAGITEEKISRKGSEFTRFVIVDLKGKQYNVTPENFEKCSVFSNNQPVYKLLKQFVTNELKQKKATDGQLKHIEYMQNHNLVDYCDVSEKGHYKWYPKGLLIQRLLLDYAAQLAYDWGAFEMKNPLVIRGGHNVVGELMGEFHERDYRVDGGRGACFLRYASDPLAFPFMQKVQFTYKQSPLKVYEEATCFRNEQQGEVSGLKRVRNFLMTDMHAACKSEEEAKKEFKQLCIKFADLMNNVIAKKRWVLGWEGTIAFFEENKDWLISINKEIGVPAFFKLMPEMSHYYAIKNEYQAITEDKSNIQVSTVQWDVKDGQRFNIGFIDEDGEKHPCPVIIHASSFGSIERTLCAILENIAVDSSKGKVAMFPLWLSPVQARLLPVSQKHVPFALDVCDKMSRQQIRVDIDDRDETLGKKIRDGEKEWIPYLIVLGDKEKESGNLAVRCRESKTQQKMALNDFIKNIHEKTNGKPFRSLFFPKRVSQHPIFSR